VTCAICDDTGWKTIEVDGVSRVTRCDCMRESAAARRLADARIPRRYQHCDLANYTAYNEKLTKALEHATRLAEGFPVVERGLLLLGPPGVGKTHLAVSILRQVITTLGARGIFYDTRYLLRVILGTYDQYNQVAEIDVLRPVIVADMPISGNGPTPSTDGVSAPVVELSQNVSAVPHSFKLLPFVCSMSHCTPSMHCCGN
jgi:DNA replication protein DnaC